jgi:hypothetical protein
MNGGVRLGRGACRDVPPYAVFWRVVAAAVAWFTQLLIGDCDRREGTPGNSGMFAARTRRSASARAIPGSSGRALNDGTGMGTQFGLSRSCALPFNARGLISRGLEQKRAIFASFLTLNHLDFSVLRKKMAKKINWEGKRRHKGEMVTMAVAPNTAIGQCLGPSGIGPYHASRNQVSRVVTAATG